MTGTLGKRKRGGRSTAGQGRKKMARRSALVRARVPSVHSFMRWGGGPGSFVGNAAYGGATPLSQAFVFMFSNLRNSGEFTSLFEQYKIDRIETKFYLKIAPEAQSASTASYPKMYIVKDANDSTALTTLDQFREHSRCQVKVMNPNRPVTVSYRPSVLAEIFKVAGTSVLSPKTGQWLDCANSDVPHYGFKWAIDDLTNTNYQITTEYRMWFQCKNVQ